MEELDKLTEQAQQVLTLAHEEAMRFNHNYLGTEHLLLGLIRHGDNVGAVVLSNLGVELNRVRSAVEFIIGRGDRMIVGEVGLTPRAKKVIMLAKDEARRLEHDYIGPEHLLLGLVREGEGIAAGVLESVGVKLDQVRVRTILVLSGGASEASEGMEEQESPSPSERAGPAWGSMTRIELGRTGGGFQAAGIARRPLQWEYLVVQVGYPDRNESGVVTHVDGREDERFGSGATPLHEALQTLGAEGWELVAVDTFAHARAPATPRYVLKRPA